MDFATSLVTFHMHGITGQLARRRPLGTVQEAGGGLFFGVTLCVINHDRIVNWSHPAYANRHIVARNDEKIVRISLQAPRQTKTSDPR